MLESPCRCESLVDAAGESGSRPAPAMSSATGGKKRKGDKSTVAMHMKYPKYDRAAVAVMDEAGRHMVSSSAARDAAPRPAPLTTRAAVAALVWQTPSQLMADLSAGPKPRLKNAPPRIIEVGVHCALLALPCN